MTNDEIVTSYQRATSHHRREPDSTVALICDHDGGCSAVLEIRQWLSPSRKEPRVDIPGLDSVAVGFGWTFVPAPTEQNPTFRKTLCPEHKP